MSSSTYQHRGGASALQGSGEEGVVLEMDVLVHVLLERRQAVPEGSPRIAGS